MMAKFKQNKKTRFIVELTDKFHNVQRSTNLATFSSHFFQEVTSVGQGQGLGGLVWTSGVETPNEILPLRTFKSSKTSCENKHRKKNQQKHEYGQQDERNSWAANTRLENLRGLSLLLKQGH